MTGGALVAQMIAMELELMFAFTERRPLSSPDALCPVAYRLPPTVARVLRGKQVAIVDDVVNAGSAIRGTFDALVQAGANPTVVGALLALGETVHPFLRQNRLEFESLEALANPLWTPENCPLCARAIPLDGEE
jgi:orotate phosphoribosyltransferase